MRLGDLLPIVAAAILVGSIFSVREKRQAEQIVTANALYEEARVDGLLWRSRYEERAGRLRELEREDKRLQKLAAEGRALPLPLGRGGKP